ncbi:MAG: sensor histidine kinase [Cyanobacteria bacterium RYN_339]|nr:sensor histidine kinase [Cyanobacteria bacterium RYN_339]
MDPSLTSQALAELNELLWTLPSSLDPQEIVAVLLERCTRLFQAPLAAMWVRDQQGIGLAGVYGFSEKKAELLWQKLDLRTATRARQLDGQELHALGGFGKRRLSSLITVPLQSARGLAGWLVFARLEPAPFTDLERSFLEILANRVAGSLDNARVYQETQARSRELELLNEIAALLVSTTRLDELLTRLVSGIVDTLELSSCYLYLLEGRGPEMRLRASHHRDPTNAESLRSFLAERPLRIDQGRSAEIYRHGRPILVPNIAEEQVMPEDLRQRVGPGSVLIVPLKVRGEFLGAIYLVRTGRAPALTEELLPLVTHLANQVSVAIANARLYEGLENEVAKRAADVQQDYEELARRFSAGRDFFELVSADLQADLQALDAGLANGADDPRLADARAAAASLNAHLGQLFSAQATGRIHDGRVGSEDR